MVASYQFNRPLMNGWIGFLKVPVSPTVDSCCFSYTLVPTWFFLYFSLALPTRFFSPQCMYICIYTTPPSYICFLLYRAIYAFLSPVFNSFVILNSLSIAFFVTPSPSHSSSPSFFFHTTSSPIHKRNPPIHTRTCAFSLSHFHVIQLHISLCFSFLSYTILLSLFLLFLSADIAYNLRLLSQQLIPAVHISAPLNYARNYAPKPDKCISA